MATLTTYNPNNELRAFRNLFDRAFAWPPMWPATDTPVMENLRLDMYEKDNNLVIEAAMPGVDPKDVDITIDGDMLTIRSETKRASEVKEDDYYMNEQYFGAMHRTVRLPADVEMDKAHSHFKNGMVTITLPKAKTAKPRKIKVQPS